MPPDSWFEVCLLTGRPQGEKRGHGGSLNRRSRAMIGWDQYPTRTTTMWLEKFTYAILGNQQIRISE